MYLTFLTSRKKEIQGMDSFITFTEKEGVDATKGCHKQWQSQG